MLMKHSIWAVSVVVLSGLLTGCAARNASSAYRPLTRDGLCVMTYNLRYASNTPPNAWPVRRPVMRDAIRGINPDVFGTQEGLYQQLKDLASDLPEYEWIGTGRDGGSRGEFMAVFYRRDRLEPLEYDHFWLSDTPLVIASSTWGNTCRRMCTWVRFRDLRTHQQFYFLNTHLDHEVQPAREKAAALICQRVEAMKTNLPVLLVGDFNADARANKAYDVVINGGFADTWYSGAKRLGDDVGTFHGYKGIQRGEPHIDWVLTRGTATAEATQIPTFSRDGQYPSDHFPVVAWLRLTTEKP
jgi:endonuclease/exonuclease/phosphatase family metal-dependent hydrolase